MSIRNLPYIRSKDPRLYEALRDLQAMTQKPAPIPVVNPSAVAPVSVADAKVPAIGPAPSGAEVHAPMIVDTHANRASHPATITGQLYSESDRGAKYIAYAGAWHYWQGYYNAATASKPVDLGANDAGFEWNDTTLNTWERWSGAAWTPFFIQDPMTTLGDILYRGANGPAKLAGDTSNTRKFLRELSVAGVAQAPAWDTLTVGASGDVPTGTTATTACAGDDVRLTAELPPLAGNSGKTLKVKADESGVEWV